MGQVEILQLLQKRTFLTASQIGYILGQNPGKVSSSTSKLLKRGHIKIAGFGKAIRNKGAAPRLLEITDKGKKILEG
jgi:DNA-binding MarR family transcriptional regulator